MPLPAETRAPHRTKQEFVYRTIRTAILRCDLRPGERLVIEDLAQRLDVSTIPVREALQLLQSEGLVESVPHVGTTVTPLSRNSILDIFSIMEGLQIVAARVAAERATPEDFTTLETLMREMDEVVAGGRLEVWGDLNTQFHIAIATMTGLPMLQQMTVQAFDRWNQMRRYFFSNVLAVRAPQAQREHHAIVDAMRARAADRLSVLLSEHNRHALDDYLHHLDGRPADPAGGSPSSRSV
jgi:DNA-binding GntR family transcriptional regulator